ncbi:5-formyltetrahydrofolate cyclo-ligase [Brevibacterium sp. BRM-1]|uniref:5-formyltetrahydrofolate cyclo-ligase n=1 Tax=Brevibacterium sp. BRM-1 TaxID=2999062 RepID=UPI0022818832|nr:5-formyltetrahydrofolate cyclo-ligase [Brevibacterium sp. BRM-1]WAL40068.1 5-formyltetrahydrofolate cyclo-ligase [Brevibacterium sp. BRM-1]
MSPDCAADEKAKLRARVRAARRSTAPAQAALADAQLSAHVTAWATGAQTLIAYAALPFEPCVDAALEAARSRGARVLLPIARRGRALGFGALGGPIEGLPRAGRWQIREPAPTHTAAEALLASSAPSTALLVPGLAFDRAGMRLGNGGGFYDRTFGPDGEAGPLLARLRSAGLRVAGACRAAEVLDALPWAPWDLRVDAALTEAGWQEFRA